MTTRPVFIIGNGRSGTCWLGKILDRSDQMTVDIEVQPQFKFGTAAAMLPVDSYERFVELRALSEAYHKRLDEIQTPIYVDKTHPNIWNAEFLAREFPDALFLGILRQAFGVVASMFKHEGCLSWFSKERPHETSRFLGIRYDDINRYDDLPMEVKCAMRWLSHRKEMERLMDALGPRMLTVDYEAMVRHPNHMNALSEFLGTGVPSIASMVDRTPLNRWETELTHRQVEHILSVR